MERVRTLDARGLKSLEEFRAAVAGTDSPVVLRDVVLHGQRHDFTVEQLVTDIGNLHLPEKSTSHVFRVEDQGFRSVMPAEAELWHPERCTFRELTAVITTGTGLYLSTQTPNRSCKCVDGKLIYDSARCMDGSDALVKELLPRAPVLPILPTKESFTVNFSLGSYGKNFGLRTDSLTDQFFVQNQGVSEVILLLPEDASTLSPFPFVSSAHFCKSKLRSATRLDLNKVECIRTVLRAGDVLYIPPFWWHEERIISEGHSLATIFRLHLEDDERFHAIRNNICLLCERAKSRGADRLARHLCSYLAFGLSSAKEPEWHVPWPLQATLLLAAGFLLGCWSSTAKKLPWSS